MKNIKSSNNQVKPIVVNLRAQPQNQELNADIINTEEEESINIKSRVGKHQQHQSDYITANQLIYKMNHFSGQADLS